MSETGLHEIRYTTAWADRPLRVYQLIGTKPGPTLAVIGAVHGDELEGPLTISQLMETIEPAKLSGRLILCPVANPDALAASQRCSPSDGLNLARCFPGDRNGKPTEVLADLISRYVIGPADALIDLHSGGGALDCPIFVGFGDGPETGPAAKAMADAFSAPVVWRHPAPLAPGRTLSEAERIGIPAIYVEAGGGIAPSEHALALYGDGVRRVMASLGMLQTASAASQIDLHVYGSGDLDAAILSPATGLCTCTINLLESVAIGDTCFEISDIDGKLLTTVIAQTSGIAMFLRRSRWVNSGDLLMASAHLDA
ncbi:succinylglutamate desuccinylase/aspartoacylase family protein [Flavimaricola marinus]|uniref:Succinylglutamate desuccinylase / Aspartoacylase family protein n=1 Tax=Flavimaricola marinus TaxID=1819565 RepID=A0A238LHM4_9RHOB|nr:succinylglutamate desuccinylase/aspartoacylase family protein [Flavimaricola marinus]SMY08904.1 Succinylglutamate desuccinylase / Aspartoacylase family protein [Flavimaricola marinus]